MREPVCTFWPANSPAASYTSVDFFSWSVGRDSDKQIVRALRPISRIAREEPAVDELARPFLQLWDWIDRVGGYPGKLFFLAAVIMAVIGFLTWFGNKR